MAGDAPGFFSHIEDTSTGQEAKEAFADNPEGDKNEDNKPTIPEVTPTPDDKSGDKGEGGTGDDNDKREEEKDDEAGDKGTGENDGAGDKKDGEENKQPVTPPEKLILGKYKTVEEAEAALKTERESLDKLKTPPEPDKFDEELKAILASPTIEPQLPNTEHYYIEDDQGAKTFDINQYMQDYTRNLVMSIQKEFLGGRMAAAQFGLLQKAMGEGRQAELAEAEKMQFAQDVLTKIETAFPVLKTDAVLQEKMERLIYGEQARRTKTAEAAGTEVEGMVYEDYEKLAMEVVGSTPPPEKPADDPAEKPKGGPTYSGKDKRTGDDQIIDDIDAMMKSKKRSLF